MRRRSDRVIRPPEDPVLTQMFQVPWTYAQLSGFPGLFRPCPSVRLGSMNVVLQRQLTQSRALA